MSEDKLPAIPGGEPEVLDGEIVQDAPRQPVIRMASVVVSVARHPHVQRGGRHAAYIPLGAWVAVRWAWNSRSTARFERHIRIAEAAGDQQAAREWEVLRQKWVEGKHTRRMERAASMRDTFRALPFIVGGFTGVLGLIGVFLAIAGHRFAAIADPFKVVATVVQWAAVALAVSYGPFLLAAPWLALAALWWTGKHYASTMQTGWLAAPRQDDDDTGLVLTADTIVLALQNLGLPALKAAFKDGWRPVFSTQPVRDGRGYEAEFSVPLGVTADMVADKRPVLARNLHRDEIETWPSAGAPGYVRLWVADRGAIGKAAPPYPLLHEGEADVFTGVPGGVLARGDGALIPVVGANGVLGGMMGQGKSNGARVLMLGCALDPLCGLDAWVFANNGDFDAYAPRLAVYRKGLDDDVIAAAAGRLQDLYEDVAEREKTLADLGAKKVTRQLAAQYPRLRPHVALFSECHELFGHPEFGDLAAELAVKTAKRARKTGVVLWFDTQSSRKSAIPPALVELVSVNCCFAVKAWRSNDGFLGDGSFAAGIRATELRPGRDRGTSLVTGISDAQFELLKWYYIEVDDDTGYDAATDVIARAMANVAAGTPVASGQRPAIEARDLLSDLDAVLGEDRVRLADVPARLRKLAPAWRGYRDLTGIRLRELLEAGGVRVTNPKNVPTLDPADVRAVLRERGELDARDLPADAPERVRRGPI